MLKASGLYQLHYITKLHFPRTVIVLVSYDYVNSYGLFHERAQMIRFREDEVRTDFLNTILQNSRFDRVTPQATLRRPLTEESLVQSQVSPCGICSG